MTATSRAAPTSRAGADGAAPWHRRVLAQAGFETRAVLRNGEQLILTLVLPVLFLVVLARTELVQLDTTDRIGVVAPGALALAVMSTAFTSQAIATGFDRRSGVLRLLATTPLGPDGLLVGKVLAILAVELIQLVVLGGVAAGLGWRPTGVLPAVLLIALGTAAFTSLALLVAGTLRAEAVLAGANLLWVLLLVGGGILLPVDTLPDGLATVVRLLPSGALGEGLRAALGGDGLAWASVAVLGAWTLALGAAARKLFRWS